MHLQPDGHPIHTRALNVVLRRAAAEQLEVRGSLLDLRKRGFVPVGSELQGTGIIHHMQIHALVEEKSLCLLEVTASQPTVAFEASPATGGESCRDNNGDVGRLIGCRLDDSFTNTLRQRLGGPLGCSHVLTLLQFAATTAPWAMQTLDTAGGAAARYAVGSTLFKRDLIVDGYERDGGGVSVVVQLGDLLHAPGNAIRLPADRLEVQDEMRVALQLDGWPATIRAIRGGRRRRGRATFATASWREYGEELDVLIGMSLGKGATAALSGALAGEPPLRDALLMLGPTLIQCRAAFPDKWLDAVVCTPQHPGLVGLADSCYMWRRGGGLEQIRDRLAQAAHDPGK